LAILLLPLPVLPTACDTEKLLSSNSPKNFDIILSITISPAASATPSPLNALATYTLPLTTLSTFSRVVHLLNTSHALHFNSNLPLHLLLHLLQLHCCVRRATAFYRAPYCPLLPPCPSQFHRAGRLFSPLTLLGVYTNAFLHLLLALLRSVHWMVSPTLRCPCHWRAPTPLRTFSLRRRFTCARKN
jgi:hypothetical protein